MTFELPKIVVVTPVKNEAWILDRFLAVTSQFADYIIIADQNSTDESVAIAKKYPKVTLIKNNSEGYDEAERQILLIQAARDIVPEQKIILALDADEILAANATKTLGWQSMLKTKPGTVLCFEKPDLYLTTYQCIRYARPWPIGYVDDGAEHKPQKIHSIRVPTPEYAPRLNIYDVKIIHYGMVRLDAQASKRRMYCVIENVFKTTPFPLRRLTYLSNTDWTKQGNLKPCPDEWFQGWEDMGIDMRTTIQTTYYSSDYEVLKFFYKYGTLRFWLDDIWNFDWEKCRSYAKSCKMENIPDQKVLRPPKSLTLLLWILDKLLPYLRLLAKSIF